MWKKTLWIQSITMQCEKCGLPILFTAANREEGDERFDDLMKDADKFLSHEAKWFVLNKGYLGIPHDDLTKDQIARGIAKLKNVLEELDKVKLPRMPKKNQNNVMAMKLENVKSKITHIMHFLQSVWVNH